jgi:hypothetical protein
MTRPDEKEEAKKVKPSTGKEFFPPKENEHQHEADDQTQEWGVKEPAMTKSGRMGSPQIV